MTLTIGCSRLPDWLSLVRNPAVRPTLTPLGVHRKGKEMEQRNVFWLASTVAAVFVTAALPANAEVLISNLAIQAIEIDRDFVMRQERGAGLQFGNGVIALDNINVSGTLEQSLKAERVELKQEGAAGGQFVNLLAAGGDIDISGTVRQTVVAERDITMQQRLGIGLQAVNAVVAGGDVDVSGKLEQSVKAQSLHMEQRYGLALSMQGVNVIGSLGSGFMR